VCVVLSAPAPTWAQVDAAEPQLAAFVADRLRAAPAYLASVRADGTPRVHPVTPIVTPEGLFVFMEPTSPKGTDLRERRSFTLHSGVPDSSGSGGEAWVSGTGCAITDEATRSGVAAAASYDPAARYVLFELCPTEVRCNGYDDVELPACRRWSREVSR
jgi:hypothetical protein